MRIVWFIFEIQYLKPFSIWNLLQMAFLPWLIAFIGQIVVKLEMMLIVICLSSVCLLQRFVGVHSFIFSHYSLVTCHIFIVEDNLINEIASA